MALILQLIGSMRIWWEITIEKWLPLPPHICEHSMPVMQPKELFQGALGIRKERFQIAEMSASDAIIIDLEEEDDLVIVLRGY